MDHDTQAMTLEGEVDLADIWMVEGFMRVFTDGALDMPEFPRLATGTCGGHYGEGDPRNFRIEVKARQGHPCRCELFALRDSADPFADS